MKRKIMMITMVLLMILCLTGCAKLVSTEQKEVEVTVVDIYHRPMYTTPIRSGKMTIMQTHPAIYRTHVEYNGVNYTVSGSSTYNKYKSYISDTVTAVAEIRTYDDGSTKIYIVKLGNLEE